MISQKQATSVAVAGRSSSLKLTGVAVRPSVRIRVSTEEAVTEPPKVDFTPNTQAVSGQQAKGTGARGLQGPQ